MYGLPILAVMICCFILLSFNAGFVPRFKNGKLHTSCCHSCCTSSVAKSRRAQKGRKESVNVIVSRLTRGVSNVSRLPASTEDDLQLPFLVDDALHRGWAPQKLWLNHNRLTDSSCESLARLFRRARGAPQTLFWGAFAARPMRQCVRGYNKAHC